MLGRGQGRSTASHCPHALHFFFFSTCLHPWTTDVVEGQWHRICAALQVFLSLFPFFALFCLLSYYRALCYWVTWGQEEAVKSCGEKRCRGGKRAESGFSRPTCRRETPCGSLAGMMSPWGVVSYTRGAYTQILLGKEIPCEVSHLLLKLLFWH